MKPEVIGITSNPDVIAKMLGVENKSEYGLYQETKMGRYYAKYLSDGSFEPKVVHLVTAEQAAKLEEYACANINPIIENIQGIQAMIPAIDPDKMKEKMAEIGESAKAGAQKMGKEIREKLENTCFHPKFGNN